MSSEKIETRERILVASVRLLESRHGGGVRMSDVAREAGLSRQSVYDHFGSRAELMISTAKYEDEVRRIDERLRGYRAAVSGRERLREFVDFWGNYLTEIYGIARALIAAKETDEAIRAAWDDRMRTVHDACRDIAGRLESEGNLADGWDVDSAGDLLWATLSVSNWESLTIERGWSVESYVKSVTAMCESTFVKEMQSKA